MEIVLVVPAARVWNKSTTLTLGIAYLAAYLEQHGYRPRIIDFGIERHRPLGSADLVGITATTPLINSAWRIADQAKCLGARTVLGGPHVSALPEESLRQPFVDFVVRGEGEETLLELCMALESGTDLASIRGLGYKDSSGAIRLNPERALLRDLDSLPFPAYHLFPDLNCYTNPQPLLGTRKPAANIMTSRGCPFNCYFCYKGIMKRTWRGRSPDNVVAEWEYLVKELHVREIGIQDDCFNTDIERVKAICEGIIKRGLVVPWSTPNGIRADLVNQRLLKLMKRAGCYRVAYGVETGSPEIMQRIGKNISLDVIRRAFELTHAAGIKTIAFMIIGHPWDTAETIKQTIEFPIEVDAHYAQFTSAMPVPGSELFEMVRERGEFVSDQWEDFDHYRLGGAFACDGVTAQDIEQAMRLAYRRFYLRPRFVLRLLSDSTTYRNIPNILKGGLHFLAGR